MPTGPEEQDRTSRARWVVVVRADQPEAYAALREHFADRPDVEVLLDRRVRERRKGADPTYPVQRRIRQRRAPREWTPLGYVIARHEGAEPIPGRSLEELEATLRRLLAAEP